MLYKRTQIVVKAKTFTILTSNERIIIRSVQNADCRLQTGYKMQTRYKMQTADCRLGTKCRLSITKYIITYPVSRNRHFFHEHKHYCGKFPARFLIYYVLNRVARPQSFLNKISSCLLICWLTCRSPKRPPCCRDDPRTKMVLCYVTCPRYHIACCCMSS